MKKVKYLIGLILTFALQQQLAQAQKGQTTITAGPMISFPFNKFVSRGLKNGLGLEMTGEYRFTKKSGVLLQLGFTSFKFKEAVTYYEDKLKYFSVKLGYSYDLTNSGFFLNGLVGTDIETMYANNIAYGSLTLGAGKRFSMKDGHFIDVGMDYINGDTEGRFNFKAAIGLTKNKKSN